MAKYSIAAFVLSLFLVGQVSANPDVVIKNGDVRILGLGNSMVFADGSTQQSAAASSLVVQTVSTPGTFSFPNGQASPAVQTCVQCPQGMVALGGGGVQTAGGVGFVLMNGSSPSPDSTSWCVTWVASLPSPQSQTGNVQTWATCVKTSLLTTQ